MADIPKKQYLVDNVYAKVAEQLTMCAQFESGNISRGIRKGVRGLFLKFCFAQDNMFFVCLYSDDPHSPVGFRITHT